MRRVGHVALAATVLLLLTLLSGALTVVSVSSDSMTPTICPGDRLLVWTVRAGTSAETGDLVVLHEPGTGRRLVKRVVAVGGQTVELVDGRLVVDGLPRIEPYVDLETVDGTFFGPVTVRPGSVFVLGDERERSVDSRDFGDVPRSALTGRVVHLPGRCVR